MRKRWIWALVLALALQSLAFAACAEEETVEPATDETFVLRDGFTWQTTQEELLALMDGCEYSVYSSHESDFSDASEGAQEKTYEYSEYDGYEYEFYGVPVAGYQSLMSVMYSGKVPLVIGYRVAKGDAEKLTAALEANYTPAAANEAECLALLQTAEQIAFGKKWIIPMHI